MSHISFEPVHLAARTSIPRYIYGTAEKANSKLIFDALKLGYRGLDTAGQPQYYNEAIVGEALAAAFRPAAEGGLGLKRDDIYIQTKFTTPRGQDFTQAPYLENDPIAVKVEKSVRNSLAKLRVGWVDALLLHRPMATIEETIEVWKIFETYVPKFVRVIGLSNISLEHLRAVAQHATILPVIVQNCFHKHTSYDRDLRSYCEANGVVYQAFSVLRLNRKFLSTNLVSWLASRTSVSREGALLALVLSLGASTQTMCVLIGSSNIHRMKEALESLRKLGQVPSFIVRGFEEELDAACHPSGTVLNSGEVSFSN